MARAIWKGRIRFGDVDVPVKLYSAVQDRAVHFRLLDAKELEPVKQQMVNPETGDIVTAAEIRRAFETEEGDLVILDEEELAQAVPEASRDIEITAFLPPDRISHQWYDRPYYLGPDEDTQGYFALATALREREVEGLAKWVMRNKEYIGALRAEGDYLMLITMRYAEEVVAASALEPPQGRALDDREMAMARQLISALEEDEFDITAFRDEYRHRVVDLVEAKAAGKVVKFPRAQKKKTDVDLADVLEQSLAAAAEKKRKRA